MIDSLGVRGQAQWFPKIMKQHAQPQIPVSRYAGQRFQRMLAHGETVVGIVLLGVHHGIKFRQDHRRDVQLPGSPQRVRMGRQQQLHQLRLDPLRTDLAQVACQQPHRLSRLFLNGKSQLGRKAHRPQHPQGILAKPLLRVTHAADDALLQILIAAEAVLQSGFLIVCHGIDGKIPAFQVFFQIGGEGHL